VFVVKKKKTTLVLPCWAPPVSRGELNLRRWLHVLRLPRTSIEFLATHGLSSGSYKSCAFICFVIVIYFPNLMSHVHAQLHSQPCIVSLHEIEYRCYIFISKDLKANYCLYIEILFMRN
jgi:hypothetical protein